ncbi:hypothetical protein GCM10018790_65710 [Kitasatospora xanthocidica]|uniref:DUF6461 domain-containing protein n=1 Tax=Kitasatospora xanthocidica TaxID=83382 RepID=UPI001676F9BA|nr:DUF6461 domain-containing protein [Kitasatospora xanthocidica]GHF78569.1 hypothetical protein GCM10018790_65710 [Kitasatospora xanthocidica]
MGDGIQWLLDHDDWCHSVFFGRGLAPEELALRMGGVPGSVGSPITGAEAWRVVMDDGTDDEDLVRVGAYGEWSFALEYGIPTGAERLADISRGGVEVVRLDPQPDHPPKQFAYARDGVEICSFGLGEEVWRWGQQPDFLLADLVRAGVLLPDGESARSDEEGLGDEERATLGMLESRFGLALPRDVEERPLPAFVIR